MKKSILALFITSAFILTGCQEKELKAKLEYAERDITHLKMDLERSQSEMKKAKEELQTTKSSLETTQTELNSFKERLQSTENELNTTKENLQHTQKSLEEKTVALDQIQAKIPSLPINPVTVFAQHEKFQREANAENQNGINESEITYMLTAVETGFNWLDNLLYKSAIGEFKIENNLEKAAQIKAIENPKEQLTALWQYFYESDLGEVKNFETRENSYIKSIEFIGQRGKLLTFSDSTYVYQGGAHGMFGTRYFNIDTEKQILLGLDDVFPAEKQEALKEALWQYYEAHYGVKEKDKTLTYADKNAFYISKEFYFTPYGMYFVYPPYELGAYAQGEIQLNLSWTALQELINAEYSWVK
ncbi:MAG: DUF3298 domain-containing protein [Lonepinella koalarum]|nr:DUF3298 domain-containing protein [Lonepinella koalarum]